MRYIYSNYYNYFGQDPFYLNLDFWTVIFSGLTLGILSWTLFWVWRYTKATQKILDNETTPIVETNMLYRPESKETYFWFYNPYKIPALIRLIVKVTSTGNIAYDKVLRVAPDHQHIYHFKHTAGIGLFRGEDIKEGEEVTVDVECRSAMKNNNSVNEYRKSYRFNRQNMEWNESTWGYPDLPFPKLK